MPDLDKIDLCILDALQRDATLSTADLAAKVGLSQSPCWRRLSRLRDEGYIVDQVSRLARDKLGFTLVVFANVKLSAHGRSNLEEFAAAIRRFPEVVECHAVMGSYDYLLRIITRDMAAYEQFVFSKLSRLKTVQEIHSTAALSEVKSTTALPLVR
jgi:Lrp/AsnC family transcriptional regulator